MHHILIGIAIYIGITGRICGSLHSLLRQWDLNSHPFVGGWLIARGTRPDGQIGLSGLAARTMH